MIARTAMQRPWIANTLTVLCLLCALALCALWAYTYRRGMELDVNRPTFFYGTSADRGHFSFFWGHQRIPSPYVMRFTRSPIDQPRWLRDNYPDSFARFGFGFGGHSSPYYRLAVFPFWLPTLLLTTCTALGLRAWRRRRRLRRDPHACAHCGYDCRATPDRCPECGANTPNLPV